MPRVSVIVPAHDSAQSIVATLESVRGQTFPDWEVVVCDDASTDATAEVVERLRDPRISLVRAPRNLGPAGARNLALERAQGELVAFLDADDRWLPRYLQSQVEAYDHARTAGDVGLVACDAHIEEAGRRLEDSYLEQFAAVEPLGLDRVLRRNCVFISALAPRAVVDELGGFAPELFGTEDHDLWIRILETGRRAVLNREILAVYRRAPGSVSSNVARMGANNQRTYARALARGRLSPDQRRIARSELRYNRAMEAVAGAWFDRRPARLLRALPSVLLVAATRPDHWRDWLRVLRPAA